MTMPSTKYENNSRPVEGANVTVYGNDVVLKVNTASQACIINLDLIPSNHWNTPWRLYIYDDSNNASVNNITVNAGAGQTINGASNLVININGGRSIIFISSDTSFLALLSNFTTGGVTQAYTTVQDEGVSLPQRSIMNFVGAGVTATDSSGTTIITIPGGITQAYTTVQDHGSNLTQRSIIDFEGPGVTVIDGGSSLATIVTIKPNFVYATKNLFATSASFAPNTSGQRSFLSGTRVLEWSSQIQSSITGFVLSTGTWTVPVAGIYSINARLVTRLLGTDVDSNVDISSNGWITEIPPDGGFIAIGVYVERGMTPNTNVICSNKQFVTSSVISDVNVDCSCQAYALQVGDLVKINILNKTNNNIEGFASSALPDCVIEFSALQIA